MSNLVKSVEITPKVKKIPLTFWCNENTKLAIPYIFIGGMKPEEPMNLKLRPWEELVKESKEKE